jgi:hypothetical protein
MLGLQNLYPRLSIGGFLIVDGLWAIAVVGRPLRTLYHPLD